MKSMLLGLTLLASFHSYAMSGKTPPSSHGSSGVQCAWYDGGSYEEHSPHLSQQECLASGHATCEEQCFRYEQVCSSEGSHNEYVKDAAGNPVMKEILTKFSGRDSDMWRAQEMALNNCRVSYPTKNYCRLTGCTEDAIRVR